MLTDLRTRGGIPLCIEGVGVNSIGCQAILIKLSSEGRVGGRAAIDRAGAVACGVKRKAFILGGSGPIGCDDLIAIVVAECRQAIKHRIEHLEPIGAIVVSVGVALDALDAELRSNADTQAIIEAMTTKANEFFFLAARSMLPIVAQYGSRRIGS